MKTVRKTAKVREKEIRLAIFRIERGRSHTAAKRLSISAVAKEAGVSPSLLHNHYPALVDEIRSKQGASSRQLLDAKQDQLAIEKERTRTLRTEVKELQVQVAKLASINEMLSQENRAFLQIAKNSKIVNFASPLSKRGAKADD